ncbi:RICIN domain-containing protein [Streptomyces achromogenes]|uniref:RICIN domain-containing protein n=1 Tax=Streptomyces achromogenes TaxID=67255 RepID=UPI00370299BD
MAFAFRKSLGVLALALTAAVFPSAAATAATPGAAGIGNYCLSNTWGTPEVRTRVCANEAGQRWRVVGDHVVLAADPHYCLSNTWGTPEVRTRLCADEPGQRWNEVGDHFVLAADPHYCLSNTWGTPEVRTRVCANEPGQRWAVWGDHITLTQA